jgi:hypothetical protein
MRYKRELILDTTWKVTNGESTKSLLPIPHRDALHAPLCRAQIRCAPVGMTNDESVVCQGCDRRRRHLLQGPDWMALFRILFLDNFPSRVITFQVVF